MGSFKEVGHLDNHASDSSLIVTTRALSDIVSQIDVILDACMDVIEGIEEPTRSVCLDHCSEVVNMRDQLTSDIEQVQNYAKLKWNDVEYVSDLNCSCRPRRGALELDNQHLFYRYQELLQLHQHLRRRCWKAEIQVGRKVGLMFKPKKKTNHAIYHKMAQSVDSNEKISYKMVESIQANHIATPQPAPPKINYEESLSTPQSWESIKENPVLSSIYEQTQNYLNEIQNASRTGRPHDHKKGKVLDREISAVLQTLSQSSILSSSDVSILRQLSDLTKKISPSPTS